MTLEIGWVRTVTVEASNLAAHCGLKKMVGLRTKTGGVWLFYNLFVCIFYIRLMSYYMSNWALWVAMNCRNVLCFCCISIVS